MEKILNEFLSSKELQPDFVICYRIGNSFLGETMLELMGNGTYFLQSTVTHKRKLLSFRGRIDIDRLKRIVKILIDSKVWKTKHLKFIPGDDEGLTSIEVSINDRKYRVSLFISEIVKTPTYDVPQEALLQLIREISHNRILEQGR